MNIYAPAPKWETKLDSTAFDNHVPGVETDTRLFGLYCGERLEQTGIKRTMDSELLNAQCKSVCPDAWKVREIKQ